MYSLLDLSYARWLSAEPEVVRCRRRWTVVLRRCRDARSRRAAPHDLATSHDQFSVARSLPRWTSRRARCFHALTTLCYLAASIQTNFLSIYQTSSIRFHIDMPPSEVSESANDVPEVGDVYNNMLYCVKIRRLIVPISLQI